MSEEDKLEAEIQKRIDKRIKRFTAKEHSLKEQLKQERAKNQDLNQRPAPPNPAKFIDAYGNVNQEEYQKAFAEYEDHRDNWKEAQSKVHEEDQDFIQEIKKHEAKFIEKGAKLAEKYPDWYEILNKEIWTPNLRAYLHITEDPELAIYLGKHEEEAKAIGAMPMAKMEAELEAINEKMKNPVRPVTKIPAPITPVDDAKHISPIDESKMTDQQWKNWRDKERLKKLKTG